MKKVIISAFTIAIIFLVTPSSFDTNKMHLKPVASKHSEKKYDQPDKAALWLRQLRSSPSNANPAQLNKLIKNNIDSNELFYKKQKTIVNSNAISSQSNKATADLNIPKFKFENLGPSSFGGRIRGFVIHPENSNLLLAGAVAGGVFKSLNAGQSWQATSDFLPTLTIGSMISDPDNSQRVFAGTGEGFFNFDAARGAGIFVSNNFGETWQQLATTDNEDFYYVNRLTRIPNSNVLIAATRRGIFRSANLGQSWQEVSNYVTSGRGFVDLKVNPSNRNHLLAAHYGRSNNVLNLQVTSPAIIMGDYLAIPAAFGPEFPANGTDHKTLLLVNDGNNPTNDGCSAISNDLIGKIALIQRGACNFTVKVKNAQDSGALAVIVYQNTNDSPFNMGGEDNSITIPAAMISIADGELIAAETGLINANIKEVIADILGRFVTQSTDAGASWQILDANNGLPEKNVGRMEIAFGLDGVNYIAAANADDETLGLWRSNGLASNYRKTTSNTKFIARQGWYDMAIAVHPNNSNTVFMGAIDQYKTTNAGSTIVQNSTWKFDDSTPANVKHISNYMHSDHHGYYFDPHNPSIQYIVQDAGIYKSLDNGDSFFSINNGLSISQSYGIAVSPNGKQVNSGTQDNGSQIYFGDNNAWIEWQGGDGGYSAWDQQNEAYLYGSNPGTNEEPDQILFGSADGGTTIAHFTLPDADGALFIEPFALDPNNGNRLIVGTDNVFYTNNTRAIANATFTDITDTLNSGSVSALTFNQQINNQILVGMTSGDLYKVNNIGSQNNVLDISPSASDNLGSLAGWITDIKIDSKDATGNTIYITRASYASDRVLKSTDGGNSWISISGNLPDMPIYQVSIDPTDAKRIFIGSELGLWVTNLNGENVQWTRYHYGLAYTRVIDLVWHENDTLFVATHGRGTFKASRNALDISIKNFVTENGNVDANGVVEDDGIIDSGENGTLMLELYNNSGFAIDNAQLSITANELLNNPINSLNLASIPAHSAITVPIEIALNVNTSCLNIAELRTKIQYDNVLANNEFDLLTAANINNSNNNFIANAENIDNQMSITTLLGNSPWRRVTNSANSGASSWFTSDEDNYSDKSLTSPWLVMNAGGNILNFALKYATEGDASQLWDGVVLEIREQDGLWFDIGHLSSINYDGQLFTNNTAQARFAWSGSHNNWRNSSVDLADLYKGKTIQFRFRMVSDSNTGGTGFWVDDITMSNVIWQESASCDEKTGTIGKIPANGYWFDRAISGHGFVLEPIGRDNLYFTIFYTYDEQGNPEWYTSLTQLENGVLNSEFAPETLRRFRYQHSTSSNPTATNFLDPALTDGRLSIDFNSSSIINNSACQDGTAGRPTDLIAVVKWQINDEQGQWCIEPIIADSSKNFPDISGNWFFPGQDSGWGISYATANSRAIATIYYYDESGEPRWAQGQQADFIRGKELTIQMFEFSGYGRLQTPTEVTNIFAGTITTNIQHALGIIEIDSISSVDMEYQGVEGGQWIRDNIPMQILTKPH